MTIETLLRKIADLEWLLWREQYRRAAAEEMAEWDRLLAADLHEQLRAVQNDRDEAFVDHARLRDRVRELEAFVECASLHAENAA